MRLFLCLKWIAALNQQNSENKKAEYNFISAFCPSRKIINTQDRTKFEMN